MNNERITLKEAAEKLNINYSTAKTIVQTYRKENRISKKPKHTIITKKSIKREQFLSRVLTPTKLAKTISKIISTECGSNKKRKSLKVTPISEARTLAATAQANENPIAKGFHRIESAGQMQLLEAEEGPKPGQVTRAVVVDIPQSLKKDIFHVHSEDKSEEKLKKISCEGTELRGEEMKMEERKKRVVEINNNVEEQRVIAAKDMRDERSLFDFSRYGAMIMSSAYTRYGSYI